MWDGVKSPGSRRTNSLTRRHTMKGNYDAPLSALMDWNADPKMKTTEGGVGAPSLAYSISGVEGVCWSSRMGTKKIDKQVNYSHGLAQTKQVSYCAAKTPLVHGWATNKHGLTRLTTT
jgi:hypothetical protein